MELDLSKISLSAFQKPVIREVISIDGHVYAVMDPDQVHGRIDVAPACEPKTDFDAYYRYNLAYFNLFASAVYDEYLGLCEQQIRNQKVQSKAKCIGREGLSQSMVIACMLPAMGWGLIAFIRLLFGNGGK